MSPAEARVIRAKADVHIEPLAMVGQPVVMTWPVSMTEHELRDAEWCLRVLANGDHVVEAVPGGV